MDEVIIVGAGPAGCSLANLLTKAGLKVSVFESLPDEHTYFCGELIHTESAEEYTEFKFGEDLIFSKYKKARVIFADTGKEISVPLREVALVDTGLLKTKLRESAEANGAKFFFNTRISSVIKKSGKVFGVEVGDKKFFSKIVAGCDGSNSTVARTAGFDRRGYKTLPAFRWKFKNCKNPNTSSANFYLYKKLGIGYLWSYPSGKNKCNVGIGSITPEPMREVFDEFIRTEPALRNAEVYHRGAEMIPYTGLLPKISMPGCILIGESTGQVHPLTGGGVNSALFASSLASKTIVKTLNENTYNWSGLDEYDTVYRNSADGKGIARETRGVLRSIELHKRKNVVTLLNKAVDLLDPDIIKKAAIGQLSFFDKLGAFFRHPTAFTKLAIEALT